MRIKASILFVFLFLLSNLQLVAQCAMCKTSLESDLNEGGSIANGINTGILFLMAIPYLLLMIGGYFFFKKRVDAKLKSWKDKFFPAKAVK